MGILDRLMEVCEQVEVVELRSESTNVTFEANRLKSAQTEESSGLALRVVKDGRLGFAASSDQSAAEKLVANVLESAAHGDEIPIVFPPPKAAPEVATFDARIAELSIDHMVEMGEEFVDVVRQAEPDAQLQVELTRGVERVTIWNHADMAVSFERSPLSISLEVRRIKGDDVLILYDVTGNTIWDDEYLSAAHRLRRKLELARRNVRMGPGRMPVLFAPTGALVLALPLIPGLSGKNVYAGVSPLAGKPGQDLLDSKVNIADDGTLSGRFNSASYDDEGVPHRRNVLIERGVLKSFYYDLKTAAQSGTESTGNGSRSLFSPPEPALTNLILAPGKTPLSDMIGRIDRGLWVENALGLGQGNIISGAFSNPLSLAYKIEKGEIVGRVKDVSIAGNVYELLQDVAAVSRETEWVYNSFHLPHLLLSNVNVVCSE